MWRVTQGHTIMKPAFASPIACLALSALGACVAPPESPGAQLYASYCAACHGGDGRGDGRVAAELPVAPADLTILAAANDGVFPSGRVMAKIYGYPGQYQSHIMPEFGPLLEGRAVLWTDETGAQIETPQALIDLRDYLASIQRK